MVYETKAFREWFREQSWNVQREVVDGLLEEMDERSKLIEQLDELDKRVENPVAAAGIDASSAEDVRTVRMGVESLTSMLVHVLHLRRQVTELQERGTGLALERQRYRRALELIAEEKQPTPAWAFETPNPAQRGVAIEDAVSGAIADYAQHVLKGGDPDQERFA